MNTSLLSKLSYGSHFFQDLVESGSLYNAIFENERTIAFNRDMFSSFNNILGEALDDVTGLEDIVYVHDTSDKDLWLCNDMKNEHIVCFVSPAPRS